MEDSTRDASAEQIFGQRSNGGAGRSGARDATNATAPHGWIMDRSITPARCRPHKHSRGHSTTSSCSSSWIKTDEHHLPPYVVASIPPAPPSNKWPAGLTRRSVILDTHADMHATARPFLTGTIGRIHTCTPARTVASSIDNGGRAAEPLDKNPLQLFVN